MHLIAVTLLLSYVSFSNAAVEKCSVLCNGESQNQLKTITRKDFELLSLPTIKPSVETNLNCFKPIFVCLRDMNCNKNVKVWWQPSKESQLASKELVGVCESNPNLGDFIKADLQTDLFTGDGMFTIKKVSYYYKAITGE